MATRKPKQTNQTPEKSPDATVVLPLPEEMVSHHLETLSPMMKQWLDQGAAAPVLLFTGPRGIGKREMSYHLTQWLLCQRTGFHSAQEEGESELSLFGEPSTEENGSSEKRVFNPIPCGECKNCLRAIQNQWVDFKEISPEGGDSETGTLKIEQFRELQAAMGHGAYEGAYRIHLICNADRMTIQAANSLLKTLEEPPPGWIFILTANDPSLLLSTIVSRCQMIRLKPLSQQLLQSLLRNKGLNEDQVRVCSALAQGSLSRALQISTEQSWEKRKQLFHFLVSPLEELNSLVDWASQDASRIHLLLDHFEEITSHMIRWSLALETETQTEAALSDVPLTLEDGKREILRHINQATKKLGGRTQARQFWIERTERFFRARQEALLPLNKKLLVQDILLPWLQVT